jgi:hypothetical protein
MLLNSISRESLDSVCTWCTVACIGVSSLTPPLSPSPPLSISFSLPFLCVCALGPEKGWGEKGEGDTQGGPREGECGLGHEVMMLFLCKCMTTDLSSLHLTIVKCPAAPPPCRKNIWSLYADSPGRDKRLLAQIWRRALEEKLSSPCSHSCSCSIKRARNSWKKW